MGGARFAVALLFLGNGAAFGAWAAAVPAIKLGLGASDGALGIALLCVAVGAMAAMPAAGWLAASGFRRLMTLVSTLLGLWLPMPALAGSVPALCATLLLFGALIGSMDVCMNARASRIEAGWGAAIMSSFHAAFSMGGLIGTVVTGLGEAAGFGALGGLSLVGALLLVSVAVHLRLDPSPELAAGGARRGAGAVTAIGVLCALAFLTEGAVADWSGVFLSTVAGYGTAAAASGFAGFSVGMVAMRLLGDAAVRRVGPARALRVGGLVAAGGVALAMAWPAAGPVGFLLMGLGGANVAPILFSAAGRAGPAAVAAVATVGYGGMLLGPPLIGGVAELAGLRLAVGLLAGCMLAVAASAALARR